MSISDQTTKVEIAQIIIDRDSRQRAELEEKDILELASSIRKRGLLHPVIIDSDFRLIAGERRVAATLSLGETHILARFVDGLSDTEKQIIELEENIKRKDLGWKDLVQAMARIHHLYLELDEDWTMSETAEECNVAVSLVSMYLRVYEQFSDERIAESGTFNEAYNIIKRRDNRASGDALMDLIEMPSPQQPAQQVSGLMELPSATPGSYKPQAVFPVKTVVPTPDETILHEDFLKWAPNYSGRRFSFLHCDFPYGIDVFSGPQAKGAEPTQGYADGLNVYTALLEALCLNLDKIMSISGHMVFWYSDKHRDLTRQIFARLAPSLEIHPYPLIWLKSDNAGIAADPRHGPRHIYETALFITRGKRQIVRIVSDAYAAHTDKTLHPSTKPEPMLRHFFQMLVDEQTSMFDPTSGSGASIRAAESLGAKYTLGLEIDEAFLKPARTALKMARLKQAASSRVL